MQQHKLQETGSLLDEKSDRVRTVLREEKLDALRARLKTSPRKYFQRLTQETIVPKTSARRTTKIVTIATIEGALAVVLKEHGPVSRIHS
jgi:phosphomevalonate kinase